MAAEFFARFCAQFSTPAADAGRAASAVSGTMPGAMADGRTPSQVSGTVPTDLSIYRGLRAWRAVAIAAIAIACLARSEEHTSELQSLMRLSYAVFCLKKK